MRMAEASFCFGFHNGMDFSEGYTSMMKKRWKSFSEYHETMAALGDEHTIIGSRGDERIVVEDYVVKKVRFPLEVMGIDVSLTYMTLFSYDSLLEIRQTLHKYSGESRVAQDSLRTVDTIVTELKGKVDMANEWNVHLFPLMILLETELTVPVENEEDQQFSDYMHRP